MDPTREGRVAGAGSNGPADVVTPPSSRRSRGRRRHDREDRSAGPTARSGALVALALLLAALALLASACGATSTTEGEGPRELTVFAASSLTGAFTQLGDAFTAAHPRVTVAFNFAGSSDLIAQLRQGGPGDVIATADTETMDKVTDLVATPAVFAANQLVIAVEPDNPKDITGLAGLAAGDLKVILAAPEVPAGQYAREVLAKAGVRVQPVSLEESVKGVVTKVALGEADAGIAYVTDVEAAGGRVDKVAIPDDQNALAMYPIAVVEHGGVTADAQAFVDFVLSPEGRRVLLTHGFLPPP